MKKGFTIIEILFVCALFGIIIGAMYSFLSKQIISLKSGEKNIKAERIAREILEGRLTARKTMPGILPELRELYLIVTTGRDVVTGSEWITFVNKDTNGDNRVTQEDENITYTGWINCSNKKGELIREVGTTSFSLTVITDKLWCKPAEWEFNKPPELGFKLKYYDAAGNETETITSIRKIEVKIMIDTNGDKSAEMEVTSLVRPRNLPFP